MIPILAACLLLLVGSAIVVAVSVEARLARRELTSNRRASRSEIARLRGTVRNQADIIIKQSEEIDDLRDVHKFIDEATSSRSP